MGKIVAIGGGNIADDEDLKRVRLHIYELCGKKNPRVLFVPTAAHDSHDDTPQVIGAFAQLGGSGEGLYLTDESLTYEQIEQAILGADIIYVDGGNLKFLMDTWNRTGATELMRQAYAKGTVLAGVSSGAMCWFDMGYDDCGENAEFMFIDCVGLIPGCNCPHFDSEYWQSFSPALKKLNSIDGIAVDNDAAFCENDGKYYIIKSDEGHTAYSLKKENGFEWQDLSDLAL